MNVDLYMLALNVPKDLQLEVKISIFKIVKQHQATIRHVGKGLMGGGQIAPFGFGFFFVFFAHWPFQRDVHVREDGETCII